MTPRIGSLPRAPITTTTGTLAACILAALASGTAPRPAAAAQLSAAAQPSAAAAPAASAAPTAAARPQPQVLVGPASREQVEAAAPSWVQAGIDAQPDLKAARALQNVPPGAEVTVFLGTWCGDSRREVSRLWRALDEIGATAAGGAGGGLPFTLSYVCVDEAKQQPAAEVSAVGLRYVPTFIVRRDGREVGRIVERPPHGIETDLLALLDGRASGLLTASERAEHP